MQFDSTEWLTDFNFSYHERQFTNIYRSTECFCDWLETQIEWSNLSGETILDLGCGLGANTLYLAKRNPQTHFVGVDLNAGLVAAGNCYAKSQQTSNLRFIEGDIYNLPDNFKSCYKGLVSFQTLSWLPDFKEPIERMAALNPEFVALTSLFYEGDIDCRIQVYDHSSMTKKGLPKQSHYNVYSLNLVRQLFKELGYENFYFTPFSIDIDLPRPARSGMGTFTEKLETGERRQVSGPLLMPWYFIFASKINESIAMKGLL